LIISLHCVAHSLENVNVSYTFLKDKVNFDFFLYVKYFFFSLLNWFCYHYLFKIYRPCPTLSIFFIAQLSKIFDWVWSFISKGSVRDSIVAQMFCLKFFFIFSPFCDVVNYFFSALVHNFFLHFSSKKFNHTKKVFFWSRQFKELTNVSHLFYVIICLLYFFFVLVLFAFPSKTQSKNLQSQIKNNQSKRRLLMSICCLILMLIIVKFNWQNQHTISGRDLNDF